MRRWLRRFLRTPVGEWVQYRRAEIFLVAALLLATCLLIALARVVV